jgi:hypothetical protein
MKQMKMKKMMAALALSFPLATLGLAAQAPAAAAAPEPIHRLANGKPDLQGFYNPQAGGANFGLGPHEGVFGVPGGKGFIVDPPDGMLPMLDWAKAERQARVRPERAYDDPAAHCFQNGVPRSMYTGGFQILQPPGYIVLLMSGDTGLTYRIIPLDEQPHAPDDVRTWNGDSLGRWEGDTLVVETTSFNGKAWLNQAGEILSHEEKTLERFTPVDGATINYRITVTDPLVYAKPWTLAYPLKKQSDELLEDACHEDDQDLMHLKAIKDAAARAGGGAR